MPQRGYVTSLKSHRQWARALDLLPEQWLCEAYASSHYARRYCIISHWIHGPLPLLKCPSSCLPRKLLFFLQGSRSSICSSAKLSPPVPLPRKVYHVLLGKSAMPYSPLLQHLSLVVWFSRHTVISPTGLCAHRYWSPFTSTALRAQLRTWHGVGTQNTHLFSELIG